MKKVLFLALIFIAKSPQAQMLAPYVNMDIGLNLPNTLKANTNYPDEDLRTLGYSKNPFKNVRPLFCLSAGIQLSNVLINNDCIEVEYNQRAIISSYYPSLLGGRLLYGYSLSNSLTLLGSYGRYFSLKSTDNPDQNYWLNGYALRLHYKERASLEISKTEFFQITVGYVMLFKDN